MSQVGFQNVVAEDKTSAFIQILEMELGRFEEQKEEFLGRFGLENFNYIVDGWKAKIKRCTAGDQAWGLFTATKP